MIIDLVGGQKVQISDCDYEKVSSYTWYIDNGYARTARNSTLIVQMHRLIMDACKGQIVDHINGNKLDNRRENLRFVTQKQNTQNSKPNKGKKYKGASLHKKTQKYISNISIDGKKHYLGMFDTEEEAAREYDRVAKNAFGEYAWLNFKD